MVKNITQGSDKPWLNWIECATIAGAIGGSIIAATQQIIFVSAIPLSMAAALSFSNRQRMQLTIDTLTEKSTAMEQLLMLQINNVQNKVSEKVEDLAATSAATEQLLMLQINNTENRVREGLSDLESQIKGLQEQSESLAKHQLNFLSSTAEENAYRRGLEHDQRGEFKEAITAYDEALKINATYGEAYMGRGMIYSQINQKQLAIADLRTAAKLFFETGDLEKYHQARELSEKIHHSNLNPNQSESSDASEVRLAVDELFV